MPSADTHTLRLKNELFDLRVGYVNRIQLRCWLAEPSSNPRLSPTKERKNGIPNGMYGGSVRVFAYGEDLHACRLQASLTRSARQM